MDEETEERWVSCPWTQGPGISPQQFVSKGHSLRTTKLIIIFIYGNSFLPEFWEDLSHELMEPWHCATPQPVGSRPQSSVTHPPTLSLLVPRNVSKFAGPCETSPGCFGSPSSHSCTVPVVQVSCICFGFFLDWWGGLRMGLYLRLIAEIKKELSV